MPPLSPQHEEEKRGELKLGNISIKGERRYKEGKAEAKRLKDKLPIAGIIPGQELMANLDIWGRKGLI